MWWFCLHMMEDWTVGLQSSLLVWDLHWNNFIRTTFLNLNGCMSFHHSLTLEANAYRHTVKALHQVMTTANNDSISSAKQQYWLPLTWWEVDQGHALMAEPLDLLELLAAPQCNATLVEGGQVCSFGRPAHIRLCPALHRDTKTSSVSKQSTTVDLNWIGSPWMLHFEVGLKRTALSSDTIGSLASLLKMAVLSPAS